MVILLAVCIQQTPYVEGPVISFTGGYVGVLTLEIPPRVSKTSPPTPATRIRHPSFIIRDRDTSIPRSDYHTNAIGRRINIVFEPPCEEVRTLKQMTRSECSSNASRMLRREGAKYFSRFWPCKPHSILRYAVVVDIIVVRLPARYEEQCK